MLGCSCSFNNIFNSSTQKVKHLPPQDGTVARPPSSRKSFTCSIVLDRQSELQPSSRDGQLLQSCLFARNGTQRRRSHGNRLGRVRESISRKRIRGSVQREVLGSVCEAVGLCLLIICSLYRVDASVALLSPSSPPCRV